MAVTNKFLVWTSEREGEYVTADSVTIKDDTVLYLLSGTIVKSYPSKEFYKYNELLYPLQDIGK